MNLRFPLKRKVYSRLPRREMPVNQIPGQDFHENLVRKTSRPGAGYWKSVYSERSLSDIVYQYRQAAALNLVDALKLPEGSCVLEFASGAGVLTVALARRKYIVTAIEGVKASLDNIRRRAIKVGLQDRIITRMGDIHALDCEDQSFDLIVALGVLPWLHSPEAGMLEIMRMLKPGGYAIMTIDNRWRMNHILDPRFNPVLSPVRQAANRLLETLKLKNPGLRSSLPRMHSIKEFDSLLNSIGLRKSAGQTLAFGPFTLMNKRIFSDSAGKMIHHVFQTMAERNAPGIRSVGSQYLVLAQKPESVPEQFPAVAKDLSATGMTTTESYILQKQA